MSHADLDCRVIRGCASDYLDGCSAAEDVPVVEDHLRHCPTCLAFVDDLRSILRLLTELREPEATDDAEIRALDYYFDYYPEPESVESAGDLTEVKRLWAKLCAFSPKDRPLAITEHSEYLDGALFDWLLARARRVASTSPDNAIQLARLALEIGRERGRRYGDSRRHALGAAGLAWCAVRLRDYPATELALEEAAPFCSSSGVATEERGLYLAALGAYLAETGQTDARVILREALRVQKELGSRRGVFCAYVNLAWAAFNRGEARKAVELYSAAEDYLDRHADPPRQQLILYGSLAVALCESGATEKATQLLPTISELAQIVGGWYWEVSVRWLNGTLARCKGRYERAASVFEAVRSEFRTRGHLVLYLEASLDLARTRYQQGRSDELDELATELLDATADLGESNQLRSSVVCFAEAVRRSSLSTRLIGSIAIALRSVQTGKRL